jgi:hypothetical protein
MKPIASLPTALALIASVDAFSSVTPKNDVFTGQALYDPLGLYPKDAEERLLGRLQPLEDAATMGPSGVVKDPLKIYTDASQVDQTTEMSESLPFAVRPSMLASVPGDRGFDPFNFAADENALQWYREAEVKHARIAMLVRTVDPERLVYALTLFAATQYRILVTNTHLCVNSTGGSWLALE